MLVQFMMMEVSTRSQSTGYSSSTCTGDPGAWGILTTENCREWRKIPWFLRGWEISQGTVNDLKNTNTHTLQFHQNAAMQRWGQRICAMQQRQWFQYGGEVSAHIMHGDWMIEGTNVADVRLRRTAWSPVRRAGWRDRSSWRLWERNTSMSGVTTEKQG